LIDIGLAQNEQRNYAPALDYYQRALDLVDKQGVKSQVSELLNSIGVLYADQGDEGRALDYYQRALVIARDIKNDLLIAQTLISLGDLYYHERDFDKSVAATQESMELFKKLDIKQWVIVMNDNLALACLAQNKNEAALIAVNESLALEHAMATSETSWTTFNNLGLVHRALKQNEEAEKAFVESANAVQRLRDETGNDEGQQNYLAGRIGPYQNLVELLVEQHRTGEALSYAERMKARLLLDLRQSGRVQITNAMTPPEKEQERALNFEAVSLNSQIANENDQDKPDEKRLVGLKDKTATRAVESAGVSDPALRGASEFENPARSDGTFYAGPSGSTVAGSAHGFTRISDRER
jgi:tetratricopeptide (TPR) repeat protein